MKKNKSFLNQSGMTMVEITISVILAVAVAVAGMRMMQQSEQSQRQFIETSDALEVDKQITNILLSARGCGQLRDFKANDINNGIDLVIYREHLVTGADGKKRMDFDKSEPFLKADKIIGDSKIQFIRATNLTYLDESQKRAGIVTVRYKIIEKNREGQYVENHLDSSLISKMRVGQVLVPVGVDPATAEIKDCHLEKVNIYAYMVEKLCTETFFRDLTAPETAPAMAGPDYCAQALAVVEKRMKDSICNDLTGDNTDAAGVCHIGYNRNKSCVGANQVLRGINNDGSLNCVDKNSL